ncbi:MAG TPA: heme-binding protein [Terriglobales bacterium]|nr:heme-binding protein [Terriglobales bacterium]
MKTRISFLTLALAVLSTQATAQVADKKALTIEGARKIIAAAIADAKSKNTTGVIAVVDEGGNLMALERLDGTFGAGANVSIGKARTAVLFRKPTRFFEELVNSSGKGRTVMTALSDFTPLIGGVPIEVDGQIVGGVGVSGAASAAQDEELALAGAAAAKAFAGMTASSSGTSGSAAKTGMSNSTARVSYFPAAQVAAAFDKGAVLFDGQGRNYMVHASRRDAPGKAEIHTLDTDIIYVLGGTATFVTGGTAVEPANIAADEIRGSSITSGDTRQLAKGDVIIVPNGVPHWFKEVKGPFTYYVVKVR